MLFATLRLLWLGEFDRIVIERQISASVTFDLSFFEGLVLGYGVDIVVIL